MGVKFFQKKDFRTGEAVIKFTRCGAVIINAVAMQHLGLSSGSGIGIGYDESKSSDFVVCRKEEGWRVRVGTHGEGIFNSTGLVRHIIDSTWDRKSHIPGESKPCSVSFRVAKLPLDDDKNKEVFALLRK